LQETAYFRNGLKMTTTKALPNDLIDRLLSDYKNPEDLIGENGLLKQLTKAVIERVLQSEMTAHLGHDKHAPVINETRNARNGKSNKTLKGDFGELPIEIPRDRDGSFEPQLISKHQTRWTGFDDKIISLYSRGNCLDNAVTERFFRSLKSERVNYRQYKTRQEAMLDIADYIEPFYNRKRRHSTLGNISPVEYELKYQQKSNEVSRFS